MNHTGICYKMISYLIMEIDNMKIGICEERKLVDVRERISFELREDVGFNF